MLERTLAFPLLDFLDLSNSTVSAEQLRTIAQSKLDRLSVAGTGVSVDEVNRVLFRDGNRPWKSIDFSSLGWTDADLAMLRVWPVGELHLRDNQITDEGLALLKRKEVYVLDISDNPIVGYGLSYMSNYLKELRAVNVPLTDDAIKAFASSGRSVYRLTLGGNQFTRKALPHLGCLSTTDLGIHDGMFSVEDVLKHFTRLSTLRLRGTNCRLPSARIAKQSTIQNLDLRDSDVTNADVAAALEFPHLRRLDLANTNIDDDAFSGLPDSTNWRISLNLTNTNVSARELARTKFHSVYIGLNQFSPRELKMIREYTLIHVGERFPDFE